MAKSTITLADEAADALLVKPKQSKSSNTKGILALGLLAFALGLLATPSMRQALVGLTGDQWSLTVEGGLVTISCVASNTSRRVVGQWGGAGGAICEDHFAFCGELLGFAAA